MSEYKKTVAIDLDGVLAKYTGFKGDDIIEGPRPEARRLLHRLTDRYHVIVHTARATATAEKWLREHDLLKFISGINCCLIKNNTSAKPIAVAYIDDRAVYYDGDVEVTLALVNRMADLNFEKDTQVAREEAAREEAARQEANRRLDELERQVREAEEGGEY